MISPRFLRPALLGVVLALVTAGLPALAQNSALPTEDFSTATIVSIDQGQQEVVDGMTRTDQTLHIRILNGPDAGKEFDENNGVLAGRDDTVFTVGETVVVDKQTDAAGKVTFTLREKYRLPAIVWLIVIFVALSVVFGGITGITSILGLVMSVAVIAVYVIPRIVSGSDPLTACLVGCALIACTSLYLAHGFNKRTSIAFLSTMVTLGVAVFMDIAFVSTAKLFGMGTEESLYLQTGPLQALNLKGLLLGGILIGCLGVLDDVTTAQTAAIDEISKANPNLTAAQLRQAGKSVGKEHIASLINTLALAYVGTSLPLLLLIKTQGDYPLWVTINGEFFAEEIIRTLVGSATLLIAVPLSTWFAAYFLQGGKGGGGGHGHSHTHSHSLRQPTREIGRGISVS